MKHFPVWTKVILKAAGIYNIIWGAWVVLFPMSFFNWFDLPSPVYPMIWQSVGMIVGVYGIGYYVAAHHPQRHWPIILVGWLGKLFGPIGAIYYLLIGKLTPWFLLHNLTNDIIWLPFFTIIIYHIVKNAQLTSKGSISDRNQVLQNFIKNKQKTITEFNKENPVMLIFLRHFGCTFCRETLAQLKKQLNVIEENCEVVIVHMSPLTKATNYFKSYGLENITHVSDPEYKLYEAFEIPRGTFGQLFGPKVWWRGFVAGLLKRHGIGTLQGDGFRMPGVFVLFKNEIINQYYYASAADQPDLVSLSKSNMGKVRTQAPVMNY